jgi:hypothetical protein
MIAAPHHSDPLAGDFTLFRDSANELGAWAVIHLY